MNRRDVLRLLGLGAAGLAVDPDRRLWIPGQKKIFIPPPRPETATRVLMYARNCGKTAAAQFAIDKYLTAKDAWWLHPSGVYMVSADLGGRLRRIDRRLVNS